MSKIIPNAPEGDDFSKFYDDAVAFVTMGMMSKPPMKAEMIVNTLMHDIGGIIRRERCFCPRVSGSVADLARLRARIGEKVCPKCHQSWAVHNGDGSCVKD
jgi:hypothetical protein